MARKYRSRRLSLVRFKGRQPRALLWRKDIYEEWYHWVKLAGGKLTEEWQVDEFPTFDKWWKDESTGFELFCEPHKDSVEIITEDSEIVHDKDTLTLSIDLNEPTNEILDRMKSILYPRQKGRDFELKSKARYQPSIGEKFIQLEKIERYRRVYLLHQNGLSTFEIFEKLLKQKSRYENLKLKGFPHLSKPSQRKLEFYHTVDPLGNKIDPLGNKIDARGNKVKPDQEVPNFYDNTMRKVQRDIKAAEKIIENVRQGIFP